MSEKNYEVFIVVHLFLVLYVYVSFRLVRVLEISVSVDFPLLFCHSVFFLCFFPINLKKRCTLNVIYVYERTSALSNKCISTGRSGS